MGEPGRFGGSIPSPRQQGDPMEAAQLQAMMDAMQARTPQEPTFADIPNMTPEQLEQYNKPADDLGDAVFGGTNPLEMLMNLFRGGR